ncbi:uncharacterized protein LOC121738771 [Aricia agestis]|uniref:uncharacterized protein LOC121738771 n=1 Tax=Aricia agestis TaxID=91739 RepID=UPI001C20497E|nr:uncharacterized protein LOC121738771 [Aricia agestis]
MNEFKTYSSLFALVDSHLSKISLQESESNDAAASTSPGTVAGRSSDIMTPFQLYTPDRIIPLPKLGLSESPISSVLATQVANMLRAKERRQEEERKKSLKQEESDEADDFVIDLTKALQTPGTVKYQNNTDAGLSSSSSCESLFKLQFMDYKEEPEKQQSPEPLLPCITDMSYILSQEIYKAKCSNFGKVLSSRLRPAAPCYIPAKVDGRVKRFTFNVPSPCDLIKERLRRPTMSCREVPNILEL